MGLKYLGATLCKDGTCSEIQSRIASAMTVIAGLKMIWRSNAISFASRLNKTLSN